jgi:hypothetical protein
MKRIILILISFQSVAAPLHAELPLIRLDRIFPLGGQAGSEVTVEINGRDLDEAKELHFDHPGFKATWLKANQFKIAIAADTPPGSHELRVVGKYGISGARLFSVSRDLAEVLEKEPNDSPDKAQVVPVNCAINGNSDNNGDDFYRFPVKKGQRLVIDCQALRLDSTMRPMLALASADGKELQLSRPYYIRTDPLLDFIAPEDGDYILRIYDQTFSGGKPYRLIISDHPHIENVFPSAVVPGEKTKLEVLGRNLPGGKPAPNWILQDRVLDALSISYQAPKDDLLQQRFAFINHFASPTLNARGMQFWPAELPHALNPATVVFADAPVTLEQEPNDTPDTAQLITLPTVVCGRLDKPGDADWYTFKAKAGETVAVDLLCERLDFPGDIYVVISDAKGNELATIDDHGINFNALAQANRDPVGVFRAPSDGMYRIFVQERYRNGGPRYQYVLKLTAAQPDFYPVVVHETPNEPTCPLIHRGGSAHYELCLNRRNYQGPVTIEAEGLPPGVTCPPVHVSPQGQFAAVVFTAANDAPERVGAVRLKAWAMIDGQKVEREVRGCQRRWNIANINTSVALRQICLAVRAQAPYGLRLQKQPLTVAAGASVEGKVTLVRHWNEFKGKVQLAGLILPPGFNFTTTELPEGKMEATIKLTVAANVPPGDYTIVLRGDAQVPFAREGGKGTPIVRVADPSTPMVVSVTAAKK